jgi:DHA3 family macrolide efflux protein-like MFS transporter
MDKWKRNTALFLISQTISLFGSALVQYAIMWHITLETQSGIMMTISIICGFLPTFFLSPFAGVWADRYNRKILIVLSDGLIATATLILAILFFMGYDAIWMLFFASFIRALGTSIQTPSVSAILPQMVPEDKLTKINATNSSIQSVVTLISPMISGAMLSLADIEMIFLVDVVTALIAILILLLFLQIQPHNKALEKQTTTYFKDMAEGFNYINSHEFLKTFFIFIAMFQFLLSPAAFLTPLQVTRSFGNDVWRLTAIEITFSIGMMAGGVMMAAWGGFKNRNHSMAFSGFVVGVCTLALGIVPDFWIYIMFMCIFGMVVPIFNTTSLVLIQEKVEGDFLGRVFSIMSMIGSITMPVGMLVFGPLSDRIKIEYLLIGTGLYMFVHSFFIMKNKILLEAGKQIEK